jgi:hypothetical protein
VPTSTSTASVVSADGSTIFGRAAFVGLGDGPFCWTAETGMTPMLDAEGRLPNFYPRAASADGSVVVGLGLFGATVWDARQGFRSISSVLSSDHGLDQGGMSLLTATGISADGRTIVGTGRNRDGNQEAWIARLDGVDLVASSLGWNPRRGGLDLAYEVRGTDLERDASVAVHWATGPTRADIIDVDRPAYTLSLNTPALKAAGARPPLNVPGAALAEPPPGATHLVLVVDRDGAIAESSEANNVAALEDVRLDGVPDIVSDYSIRVIRSVMRRAGQERALLTSSLRTPADQARIMFNNLVGTGPNQGVVAQRALYRAPGRRVIGVFVAETRGLSRRQVRRQANRIQAAMEATIVEVGPENVSHHAATPAGYARRNVVDIAPSSLANPALFERFARRERRIAKLLGPNRSDPAYHLEIPQPPPAPPPG